MTFFSSLAVLATAAVLTTSAATGSPAAFSGTKPLPNLENGEVLAAGTYTINGFSKGPYGATYADTVRGAGIDKTIIELKPHSMKQNAPTDEHATGVASPTNPYYILETSAQGSLSNLTVKGTDQGYSSAKNKAKCYNGIRFSRGVEPKLTNVKIVGVPGWSRQNPGETFAIGTNHANNPRFTNVEIDGQSRGGSGIGLNNATGGTLNNVYAHGLKYGHGAALWQLKGSVILNNFRAEHNHGALSIERVQGTATLNNPVFNDNVANDINIGNDKGHTKLVLNYATAPKHRVYIVGVGGKEQGHKSKVTKSDIHLYVNGVDKTSQYVKF